MPNLKKAIVLLLPFVWLAHALPAADAAAILKAVEENSSGVNAPRDMEADMVMTIQDKGQTRIREIHAWSRNTKDKDDVRALKFLSPADVKGIGFLALADDSMYIYLPEFHRTRRIASSNMKDPFMGSDFSYEDMGTTSFSQSYDPKLLAENAQEWQLELLRKKGANKPYARIILTVSKSSSTPTRMELFAAAGNLEKVAEQTSQLSGKYWIMTRIKMSNIKKGTATIMEMKNIKLDQDLQDEIFSERFIKKSGL